MSEEVIQVAEDAEKLELNMLKDRARMMGINHSNNISVAALKAKIEAKMNNEVEQDEEVEAINPLAPEVQPDVSPRQALINEAMKLIRIRITCLDPKKKDLKGEIHTVANEVIGNVRKFVPYGEGSENGYHVPNVIYKRLKRSQFQQIRTFKVKGQIQVEHKWVKEFAIEVLDPLTPEEIARLAAAQSAAGGLD